MSLRASFHPFWTIHRENGPGVRPRPRSFETSPQGSTEALLYAYQTRRWRVRHDESKEVVRLQRIRRQRCGVKAYAEPIKNSWAQISGCPKLGWATTVYCWVGASSAGRGGAPSSPSGNAASRRFLFILQRGDDHEAVAAVLPVGGRGDLEVVDGLGANPAQDSLGELLGSRAASPSSKRSTRRLRLPPPRTARAGAGASPGARPSAEDDPRMRIEGDDAVRKPAASAALMTRRWPRWTPSKVPSATARRSSAQLLRLASDVHARPLDGTRGLR